MEDTNKQVIAIEHVHELICDVSVYYYSFKPLPIDNKLLDRMDALESCVENLWGHCAIHNMEESCATGVGLFV